MALTETQKTALAALRRSPCFAMSAARTAAHAIRAIGGGVNVQESQAGKLYSPGDPRTVAATYHGPGTCPRSCPLFTADAGAAFPSTGRDGMPELLAWLRAQAPGQLVRLAVAGEALPHLPGDPDTIDRDGALAVADAAAHLTAWTYTHRPIRPDDDITRRADTWGNLRTLEAINVATRARGTGLVVNASANDPAHAVALSRWLRGLATPVAYVAPGDRAGRVWTEPLGEARGVGCPAASREARTCATCVGGTAVPHCARPSPERGQRAAIGFAAHGGNERELSAMVEGRMRLAVVS